MNLEEYLGWLWMYLYEVGGVPQEVATNAVNAERKRIEEQGQRLEAGNYYQAVMTYMQGKQPEPTIGGYDVETQGGYNFAVVRDEAGNIIDLRSLGQVEVEGGLSAWQQQQLNQWQQEFQFQQEQARMQQQQAMMPYQQMTAAQRAQYGLQQQAQRAETMAMPPSDWIEQWYRMQGLQPQAVQQPSKRERKPQTPKQYQAELGSTIEAIKSQMASRPGNIPQPVGMIGNFGFGDAPEATGAQKYQFVEVRPGVVGQIAITERPGQRTLLTVTYPSGEVFTGDVPSEEQRTAVPSPRKTPTYGLMKPIQRAAPTPAPRTPPAPPGLSRFVPSQVTGQPITRAPTTTPSGQMWGQTPWSQQEMLRGYTGWAGYRPYEDIMQHMYAMQPQTPAGAGRKTWTPARQYA